MRDIRALIPERFRTSSRGAAAGVRTGRSRAAKGAAELSVVGLVATLVGGVVLGNGLSQTAIKLADGLTWLSDSPSGEVIQVNPATGRPEFRTPIGDPGDDLDVAQYDGLLYVLNRSTGEMTSIDMSTLTIAGRRAITAGDATSVLQHGGAVYLLDREHSSIAAMDQSTTDPIGRIWVSATPLADATIDGEGRVWALDQEGLLTKLRWSNNALAFVVEDTREVDESGAGSVLVAHDAGVTVFGGDSGIVVQEGTGDDVVANAGALTGDLLAPRESPGNIVVASAPATGTVVIVGGQQVREVDVASIGCTEPGRPEVFQGIVYVPCIGEGTVLRLTTSGKRAASDITTPGGRDAELVLDDGSLFINVPGAEQGVLVHQDGSIENIVRIDRQLPKTPLKPKSTPTPTPPPTPTEPVKTNPQQPGRPTDSAGTTAPAVPTGGATQPSETPTRRHGPRGTKPSSSPSESAPTVTLAPTEVPSVSPSTGSTTSLSPTATATTPTSTPLSAPTGVTATESPNGKVQVTWEHSGTAAKTFTISRSAGGSLVGTVDGAQRQATVTVPVGTKDTFVVAAVLGDQIATSAPSNAVDTSVAPAAASGIQGSVARAAYDAGSVAGSARWSKPADGGSAITGYTVVVTGGNPSTTTTTKVTGTSVDFTVRCADVGTTGCDSGTVSVSVTATNARGDGPAASATIDTAPPTAARLPAAGQQIATSAQTSYIDPEDGNGVSTLTLAPPADWRGFSGTCSYSHGGQSGTVVCNATSLSVPVFHLGALRPRTYTHSITFTAAEGGASVGSATYQWTVQVDARPQDCNGIPQTAPQRQVPAQPMPTCQIP